LWYSFFYFFSIEKLAVFELRLISWRAVYSPIRLIRYPRFIRRISFRIHPLIHSIDLILQCHPFLPFLIVSQHSRMYAGIYTRSIHLSLRIIINHKLLPQSTSALRTNVCLLFYQLESPRGVPQVFLHLRLKTFKHFLLKEGLHSTVTQPISIILMHLTSLCSVYEKSKNKEVPCGTVNVKSKEISCNSTEEESPASIRKISEKSLDYELFSIAYEY